MPIHSRHVQNRSRMIVAFARPPIRPAARWLADVIEGGGTEKEHHAWGQGEAEARYLLNWLTEPGSLVVDPFCGGGTIPVACKGLARRRSATERDKETAPEARRRLSYAGISGKRFSHQVGHVPHGPLLPVAEDL